ncbi:outer membrane autotransporter protein [Ereboglobus sp. PH5-5]|uniref:autotransporter outer membrane beta-barrel domain-containing protein n=1 Tax=Ereboglobus sp. PH5-5 TaxID=2940529 RepID=UPI0024076B01|nr:autotransporter outer membrane beta-barrel domain-containing protein [Ereboglobus sp. PH5-5]MDF9833913.1 outer membrane autotransporter protein [Ereboglobus sp. PH5-5]
MSLSKLPAFAALCLAATLAFPLASAGAELEWTNADDSNNWVTGSGTNWWSGSATHFSASSAVVFGSPNQPSVTPGTITITSSNGVTIGASGTNPGMIVTGDGNWEFTLRYALTATTSTNAGIGLSGSAGVFKEGTGTLTFSMTTAYTGTTDVHAGALRLNVADAIAQSSAVILASSARLDLGGYNQTLKSLVVSSGGTVAFSSTGANYNALTLDSLTGDGAEFQLRYNPGAGYSDQIILTGTSEGSHRLMFDKYGDTPENNDTSILVVENKGGGTAVFSGSTETAAHIYKVEQGANGNWYLNNTELPSRIASAVIASAAAAGQDWHYELDSLHKRMGELREPPLGGAANLWFRVNAARFNADSRLTGRNFSQYNYGATIGADKAFYPGGDSGASTWFLGAFGTVTHVNRDFKNGAGDGKTNGAGGGLYVTWLHATGWFADLLGRMDRNKNDINAVTTDGYLAEADYNANVKGLSFEFGRRLLWNEEWWIEPFVQYAVAHIDGADYNAHYHYNERTSVPVSVEKSKSAQARIALRLGEVAGASQGWHPYAKAAAVYSHTSDGRVRVGSGANARSFTANFDGWRWEVGFGAAYVINERSQFYYDYEYSRAKRYNRPWAVNAGYRYAW